MTTTVTCFAWALCGAALVAQDYKQDMPLSRVLIDGEGWELVAEGFKFTEGPAVDAKGDVFFSDIPNNRIHKIDHASKKVTVFARNTGKTNGLMFGPAGRLYGCRNGDKTIVAYSTSGDGKIYTIAKGIASNDIVVNAQGGVYVTDPTGGRVWYISPDGKKRVVAKGIKPNGLILWPGAGTLVVTDSSAPLLWSYRVEGDGSLAHRERYYLPLRMVDGKKGPGSDGMTVDKVGRLYVATHAGLQMFDPTGRMGGVIAKPQQRFMSNAVFAGPKFDYLYVTCSDKIYRRKTKSSGRPYFLWANEKRK